MNKLTPGVLTRFILTIDLGEYESVVAVFIERKISKNIDTLVFYIPKYNKVHTTALTPIDFEIISNE
jgi:hypothetical protein